MQDITIDGENFDDEQQDDEQQENQEQNEPTEEFDEEVVQKDFQKDDIVRFCDNIPNIKITEYNFAKFFEKITVIDSAFVSQLRAITRQMDDLKKSANDIKNSFKRNGQMNDFYDGETGKYIRFIEQIEKLAKDVNIIVLLSKKLNSRLLKKASDVIETNKILSVSKEHIQAERELMKEYKDVFTKIMTEQKEIFQKAMMEQKEIMNNNHNIQIELLLKRLEIGDKMVENCIRVGHISNFPSLEVEKVYESFKSGKRNIDIAKELNITEQKISLLRKKYNEEQKNSEKTNNEKKEENEEDIKK